MNGYETLAAGTRYAQLSWQLEDLQLVVEGLVGQHASLGQATSTAIRSIDERFVRLHGHLEALDTWAKLHDDLYAPDLVFLVALHRMTFRQRLRWMLTGRSDG